MIAILVHLHTEQRPAVARGNLCVPAPQPPPVGQAPKTRKVWKEHAQGHEKGLRENMPNDLKVHSTRGTLIRVDQKPRRDVD